MMKSNVTSKIINISLLEHKTKRTQAKGRPFLRLQALEAGKEQVINSDRNE